MRLAPGRSWLRGRLACSPAASGEERIIGSDSTQQLEQRQHRIELQNVSMTFGSNEESVQAVADASFKVNNREFMTIVGPSGCGKTTVLNMLAGLLEPTTGRILVDGEEVEDRRKHSVYMFQRDLLLPWRKIIDNVALGIEILGTPRRECRAMAQEILDRFDLGQFATKYPGQLSGGMRQRAALMRTLLCPKDILLLDEPFGALDALTRAGMQEWLLQVWERDHRTVVFITHDIEEAIFLSDRVLVMSARPGTIKLELEIDLPRPRERTIDISPEFNELKGEVREAIYEEGSLTDEIE